mgnify:CR=1 FL=1
MLQFLPYALAAYGGYKGYKANKDAGASGINRILGWWKTIVIRFLRENL